MKAGKAAPGALEYPVFLQRQRYQDYECYVAEILDLPGCAAEGETPSEALANLEEVKALWIEHAREVGDPVPEPRDLQSYSGKILLRMPKSLHREAALQAQSEGVSLNQYIVYLLSTRVSAKTVARDLRTESTRDLPRRGRARSSAR